jgi:thiamine-phosphate pyrophosphorylase
VILHALVDGPATAAWAARNGATVVQLRLKDVSTAERVRAGHEILAGVGELAIVVMNDDVAAAAALGCAVHLGQGDPGVEVARQAGIRFGRSAGSVEEARRAEAEGAWYVGAGAVWTTPSKADTGPAIGLDGLASICRAVRLPVVAIGGVGSANVAACIGAGAAGVAVIRAVAELPRLRELLDAALAARTGGGPG